MSQLVHASAKRLRKESDFNAVNNGAAIVPEGKGGHSSVAASVADYLYETRLTKKRKTLASYNTALAHFVDSCHKLNLEDIDRRAIC